MEAFIGIIGVHEAKVKKTVQLTECSPERSRRAVRSRALSGVEGHCKSSSAVENFNDDLYTSNEKDSDTQKAMRVYEDCHSSMQAFYFLTNPLIAFLFVRLQEKKESFRNT